MRRPRCRMMRWGCLALLGVVAALAVPALGQQSSRNFNERKVEKKPNAEDRSGIWILDFHFKDPRLITVDIPGRGRRLVWYLWYQVSNSPKPGEAAEPRTFIPKFVWVCHDENTVHHDQLLPKAQQAIQRLEDPSNLLNIKNSVSMSSEPIPVSKEFDENNMRIAYPKMVTGVATWDDINPKSDRFSIYVYGLSDGWSVVDGPDGKPIVRRKTLQLKFRRPGDQYLQHSGEIRYAGHEWVYATPEMPPPSLEERPAPKADAPGQKQPKQ